MADFSCDEVLTGRTPVDIVAESERALAFRHTPPAYPMHVVVIPRMHVPSLLELDDGGLVDELITLVRRVALEIGLLDSTESCTIIA